MTRQEKANAKRTRRAARATGAFSRYAETNTPEHRSAHVRAMERVLEVIRGARLAPVVRVHGGPR